MKPSRQPIVALGIFVIGLAIVVAGLAKRERPSEKVPRLLKEYSELPTGPFEPFYFGRSYQAIDADWYRLGPESVPALIASLKNHGLPKRYLVAKRLAEIGDARAIPALIDALEDYDFIVRMWVVNALGDMRDSRAVEPLIRRLEDEESCVRRAAAEALGQFGDQRAVAPLIQCLERHESEDWLTRVEATKALGNLGDSRAIEPIRRVIVWDMNYDMRQEGSKALRKLGVGEGKKP
jgi:HEAT repeats/PBS lyase HEAT-like repeat